MRVIKPPDSRGAARSFRCHGRRALNVRLMHEHNHSALFALGTLAISHYESIPFPIVNNCHNNNSNIATRFADKSIYQPATRAYTGNDVVRTLLPLLCKLQLGVNNTLHQ